MASYGMHSLSHSSRPSSHESSGQGFGSGHWYGSSSASHPRSGEPTVYLSCGGPSAGGGYGTCGGPSSYGRMSCYSTPGGLGAYGGYGGPGGPGGPAGPGGNISWCSPRPPQWGPSWGN